MTKEELITESTRYKSEHLTPEGNWIGTAEEIAAHQAWYRNKKQQVLNLVQEEFVLAHLKHQATNQISPADRQKLANWMPLVFRRKQVKTISVILFRDYTVRDGELFSFSEPEDIVTNLKLCDCGEIVKNPTEMTSTELAIADEHLKICTNIKLAQIKTKSVVSHHKIGSWDCRACFKEPSSQEHQGVAGTFNVDGKQSTEWCPRFLRPFRSLDPLGYLELVKPRRASCYAGILHKQITVVLNEDGSQDLVIESMCDTCSYNEKLTKPIELKVD